MTTQDAVGSETEIRRRGCGPGDVPLVVGGGVAMDVVGGVEEGDVLEVFWGGEFCGRVFWRGFFSFCLWFGGGEEEGYDDGGWGFELVVGEEQEGGYEEEGCG